MNEQILANNSKEDLSVELTSKIVASYVSHNAISREDLPNLISQVHESLKTLTNPAAPKAAPAADQKPAVPIRKSVTDEFIVCLEDGMKFKSLKRHLRTSYNLSPEDYRTRWGLPNDYPMVAPSYSVKRSELAKQNGLGRKKTETSPLKAA